jgi:adenosylhomocysteine nucleosidase
MSLLLLGLLVVTVVGSECTLPSQHADRSRESPTSYLVVMSAFAPELTRHLANTDIEDTCIIDGIPHYRGRLAGNNVILMLSGIGLERAAATTRALLDSLNVAGIVFSGIAGGINPDLKIGDVTVPLRWGRADGSLGPDDEGFWMPVDSAMFEVASTVSPAVSLSRCTPDSVCLERTPTVVTGGNGVSNSFFVDDPVYREWLWDTFQANAVDMETSAVARVASEYGVPFVAFRSLSDLAGGGPGENEIEVFFQLAADNAATVVAAFLGAWAEVPSR